jgi:hypothetical protein
MEMEVKSEQQRKRKSRRCPCHPRHQPLLKPLVHGTVFLPSTASAIAEAAGTWYCFLTRFVFLCWQLPLLHLPCCFLRPASY